jgi:hypothetical protein
LTYVAPVCGLFLLSFNYKIPLSGVFILDRSEIILNFYKLGLVKNNNTNLKQGFGKNFSDENSVGIWTVGK